MSCFEWIEPKHQHDKGFYQVKTFNFLLYPRPSICNPEESRTQLFSADTMKFLMMHKFDFEQCFRNGLNYNRLQNL